MATPETHLLSLHRELGARLIDFAGWEMPLQYQGVVAEHTAVRTACGLFDVSHLGKLRVEGEGAGAALQHALTTDVEGLDVGRATYSLVLTEEAGCVDDVFVYRIDDHSWMVVPNAANVSSVAEAIRASGADPIDDRDRYAILALQGPGAFDVFEAAFAGTEASSLKLYGWAYVELEGERCIVARTGYTGERGYELYVPGPGAEGVFRRLLQSGAVPVGLGARDTLRLEMGYALYGHELSLDINPLEAGLGWAVAWETGFRGEPALEKIKEAGPVRRLFGIRCTDRGVPRHGYAVTHEGRAIGQVTSGNHSPTLGTGIALALGDRDEIPDVGGKVVIDARGRPLAGDIVKPPFIRS